MFLSLTRSRTQMKGGGEFVDRANRRELEMRDNSCSVVTCYPLSLADFEIVVYELDKIQEWCMSQVERYPV